MPKISMLVPEEALAEIDAQAGGNRTSFMIAAALERARAVRRAQLDAEIAASLASSDEADAREYAAWEGTLADGLD